METKPVPKERVSIGLNIHQEDKQNSNWMLKVLVDCWICKTVWWEDEKYVKRWLCCHQRTNNLLHLHIFNVNKHLEKFLLLCLQVWFIWTCVLSVGQQGAIRLVVCRLMKNMILLLTWFNNSKNSFPVSLLSCWLVWSLPQYSMKSQHGSKIPKWKQPFVLKTGDVRRKLFRINTSL